MAGVPPTLNFKQQHHCNFTCLPLPPPKKNRKKNNESSNNPNRSIIYLKWPPKKKPTAQHEATQNHLPIRPPAAPYWAVCAVKNAALPNP